MTQERESRPVVVTERPEISWGDKSILPDDALNPQNLDDDLPFGPSLYADVPDMDEFRRLTIRNATAYIDVKTYRLGGASHAKS